jgi:hypothetical protein
MGPLLWPSSTANRNSLDLLKEFGVDKGAPGAHRMTKAIPVGTVGTMAACL